MTEDVEATARLSMTPRRRLEVLLAHDGRCAVCRRKISGTFIVDHRVPLWLGGSEDIDNLQPHHPECDKPKTAVDAKVRAKVKRIRKRLSGEKKPKGLIKSRGFQKGPKRPIPSRPLRS